MPLFELCMPVDYQHPQIPSWSLSGVKFDLCRIFTSYSLILLSGEKNSAEFWQKKGCTSQS